MSQDPCYIIDNISGSETSFDERETSFIDTLEALLIKPVNLVSSVSGMDKVDFNKSSA